MDILYGIAGAVASVLMAVGLVAAPAEAPIYIPPPLEDLGTTIPGAPALYDGYLATGISKTDTSLTLSTGELRNGQTLSGFLCFTIDNNTPTVEYVCGNASSTEVTNLSRGVDVLNPSATSSDLAYSHRRFASVSISDYPTLQFIARQLNGDDAIGAALSYESGVTPTGNNHLTDVEYVLGVVNGGSVSFDQEIITGDAGETVSAGNVLYFSTTDGEWYEADADVSDSFTDRLIGIAQGAGTNGNPISGGVLISGVDSNQTGLTPNSLYFLSSTAGSVQTATSTQTIGVAKSNTELILAPHVLDSYNGYSATYAGDNTFSGANTFSATSTFTGTTTFSGSISGHASSSIETYTSVGTTTWNKPAGLEYIVVEVQGGGAGGGYKARGGGGGGGYAKKLIPASQLSSTESIVVGSGTSGAPNGSNSVTASSSRFTITTGTDVVANGGGGVTSDAGGAGGTATGGDINITGQLGGTGSDNAASGGDSVLGHGGPSVGYNESGSSGAQTGAAASGYGGGGGGARQGNTTPSGGDGADGVVIIQAFF